MEKVMKIWLVAAVMVVLIACGLARADLADGLIAHWNFDESSGTIAHDSADENHGTLVNGPVWTTGQVDGALEFDGDDDYVDCGSGVAFPTGNNDRTLMAWIKTTGTGYRLIICYGTAATSRAMALGQDSGRVFVSSWGSPQYSTSDFSINDGNWHHIAFVLDSQIGKVYVNGVLKDSRPFSPNTTPGQSKIGSRLDGTVHFFNGPIDDVRIYERALSAEEVEQLYQDGLAELVWLEIVGPNEVAEDSQAQYKAIAHYDNGGSEDVTGSAVWSVDDETVASIDENGLLTTEEISVPQDITITAEYTQGDNTEAAEKQVSIFTICPSGSALDFDGVDDYVELGPIGGTDDLALAGSNFTICSWIKPNLTGDNSQRIVDKSNGSYGANGYALRVHTDGKLAIFVDGNGFYSDDSITVGIWQHVAVTGDGSDYQFYVDGLPVSGSFGNGSYNSPPSVNTNMRIGTWNHSTAREFNGSIDDVRIYDKALSAGEILASMHTKLAGDEDGLVGYWDFDEGNGEIAGDSSGNSNDGTIIGAEWVESGAPGICNPVDIDIKPGSCPNPLNLASRGVLPVAVLGSEEFDVSTIDPASIFLEGVPAIRSSYEDVASLVTGGDECECTTEAGDGFGDLTLKFDTLEIVEELIYSQDELAQDQTLVLTLTGELFDDTGIEGSDCVVLVGNVPKWLAARRWDANGDGLINVADFTVFAENWLESTVP